MPQPIKKVNPAASVHISLSDASPSNHRPELALLAMSVLAEWSILDSWLNGLFVIMCGPEPTAALDIYSSLSGGATKAVAFNAVAEKYLKPEEKEIYAAIMRLVVRARNQRNKLAHGVWGYSPQIPDGVLLCDAIPMMRYSTAIHEYHHTYSKNRQMPELPYDDIFVYYKNDFTSQSEAIRRLMNHVMEFRYALHRGMQWIGTSEAFEALVLQPDIQAEVSSIRAKNSRQPP